MTTPARPPYPVIDAHVHIAPWDQVRPDAAARMPAPAAAGAAQVAAGRLNPDKVHAVCRDHYRLIDPMDERYVEKRVMINYVTPEVVGFTEAANDFSAGMACPFPERLIPFGGIDPRRVTSVPDGMDRLLGDLRLRGIKIHPPHQLFRANAYLHQPGLRGLAEVYAKCVEYGVPVMFHTGTSIFPRARNKFGDPMDLDDLIVDCPDLKIIMAHGGRPLWLETALTLLRRSRNVTLDISSVPPRNLLRYFPWLERVADQVIFGSDWPGPMILDLGRTVEDFHALPLADETKRKILRDNAQAIFGW